MLLSAAPGFTGMFLLFAVVPVLGSRSLGVVGAGLATTVFMLTTVLTQFLVPFLLTRIPPARLMGASLLLLGIPALGYLVDLPSWMFLLVTAIRGIGFGLITIVSVSLSAHFAPAGRHGAAQGALGLVTSLSGVVSPGLALWLLENTSRLLPIGMGVVIPLVGLVFLAPIAQASPRPVSTPHDPAQGSRAPLHWTLLLPAAVFLPSSVAYGALYTFVPLESAVAAAALIAVGVGYVAGRTTGGRMADRWGMGRVLISATVIGALGVAVMGAFPRDLMVIAMSAVLGATIGAAGTASLTGMLRMVEPSRFGVASMTWNATFDIGILVSGLLGGFLIATAGVSVAIAVLAAWLAVMAVIGLVLRRVAPAPVAAGR